MTTTKITQQDLKLYHAENGRDTEDGGGLRTGRALTGADNELFDAIGDQSNALGNFSMRLLYAAVDRPDNEPLLEGGFIVAEPPTNPNVSFIAFKAAYNGELRKNAVKRVEAYSVKTTPSRMTLLAQQSAGSAMVVGYQMPNEPLPKAGEVYCLTQDSAGYDSAEEYVKIKKASSETVTRYNPVTGKYFKRDLIRMEITSSLRSNFMGAAEITEAGLPSPTTIYETMVADAGKYFGVKKLTKNIKSTDTTINVESIFDKIIPSSEVATPLTDLDVGSAVSTLSLSDKKITGTISWSSNTVNRKLPTAIKRGTLKLEAGGTLLSDDGSGGLKNGGAVVATVDYASGVVTPATQSIRGTYTYSYVPASQVRQIADSAAIGIDQTNQSNVYAITPDPPPLEGSVSVHYRAQGLWYDLDDNGAGVLTGSNAAYGSGSVDPVTNTIAATLGALPDVGSEVIFTWATPVSYFDRSDIAIAPPEFIVELDHNTITPSALTVTYLDDNDDEKTATDDGNGNIVGDNFTCKLGYAKGRAAFRYTSLPKGGASYRFDYSYGNQLTKAYPAPNRNADGSISLDLEQTNIKPNSVKMIWNVDIETFDYISTTPAAMQVFGKIDPYITVFDDGNGNLKDAAGKVYGTIDYATGIITFNPDTIVKIPAGIYSVEHIGFDQEQVQGNILNPSPGQKGNKVYRNTFAGWEYRDAGVSMPIGLNGKVDVWFNAADAANNHTQTAVIDKLAIDLTPLYAENIVGGSAVFEMGGKAYTERNGTLYYDHNLETGAAVEAGTFNYASGDVGITAWAPGQSATVNLISLSTSIDKNPVDEVVFRIPQAPIQPRSLQLRATTLEGSKINVTADADGKLTGANINGRVAVSDGVVRVRFGEWVAAAGNEGEIWYKADAVVGDKIFKPAPVFADSIKYNAVAYTYLPLDSDAIGVDTVRFPSDGRVPIYRAGDMVVVASRYKQDLGTSFTSSQEIQLNVTELTSACIVDAKNKHVTADKYTTDLAAGTITMASPLDLSAYDLPLRAAYSVERTAAVAQVDISGGLTLTKALGRDFDKAHTYVSSVMTGGKMEVYATKPFSQKVWDNVWSDELRGDDLLVKLDTKNYPFVLTDDGAITDEWVIVFRGGLTIDLYSRSIGHIITTDWLQDLAPVNPASPQGRKAPYFTLPKEAFGPTDNPRWAAGNCVRFNTQGAVLMPWIIRATQPSSYVQTEPDGAVLCLRGNTVESN